VVLFLYELVAAKGDSGWDWRWALLREWRRRRGLLFDLFAAAHSGSRAVRHHTVLIALLAAGMAAQAAAFLEKANWLTAMDTIVWTAADLSDPVLAAALAYLIGYTDSYEMQLAVYFAIPAVTFRAERSMARRPKSDAGAGAD